VDTVVTHIRYTQNPSDEWPWVVDGYVLHRKDFTDLAEPYLSAVLRERLPCIALIEI
jgi:hypothetical protein